MGLRPIEASQQLSAGAHLFAGDNAATRVNSEGYTTSVGYSPVYNRFLGMGFLKNGRARHGETIRMVDHLRKLEVRCEVTDPVVFDPDGGRMRG